MSSTARKEHAVVDEEITFALCVVLIVIAIGLELILWKSHTHNGFSSIAFTNLSVSEASQFLGSFIPNLIFQPLLWVMGSSYDELKVVQSLLQRRWALAAASLVLISSSVFSPFAGSLFTVRLTPINSTVPVISAGSIAFNEIAFNAPATFISAAGGVDSLIFEEQNLPKFILRDEQSSTSGWTVPPFKPAPGVSTASNGSSLVYFNTQAINMQVQCVPAKISDLTASSTNDSWAFDASLSDDCLDHFRGTADSLATYWIGVLAWADPPCINVINPAVSVPANLSINQQPMAIGFIANRTVASGAFCYATQTVYDSMAIFDLVGGQLANVTNLQEVQDHPVNGFAYNGVSLTDSSYAVGLAVGDAVVTTAGINATKEGIDIQQQNEIMAGGERLIQIVENALLIYLLSAAGRILVLTPASPGTGTLAIEQAKLHAYPPAIHSLAILCFLSGLLFTFAFILHQRQRRRLCLADRPGTTIGAVAAMLSERSLLVNRLKPHYTMEDIERELTGMKFGLNPHTGTIELEDEAENSDDKEPAGGEN
ncbi:hypothetical protein DL93DRAFT_2164744 [Clavulina sp. PMI_390]|nr:hypothetical protein DL93DRAFT_2164744 [Clavulina sp. PMI_390]